MDRIELRPIPVAPRPPVNPANPGNPGNPVSVVVCSSLAGSADWPVSATLSCWDRNQTGHEDVQEGPSLTLGMTYRLAGDDDTHARDGTLLASTAAVHQNEPAPLSVRRASCPSPPRPE